MARGTISVLDWKFEASKGKTKKGKGRLIRNAVSSVIEPLESRQMMSATLTPLHFFSGTDGLGPNGGLVMDASGDLFGLTGAGGTSGTGANGIFEMKLETGGSYSFHKLYTFPDDGSAGLLPSGRLTLDAEGDLYGTTQSGGGTDSDHNPYLGTIWKMPIGQINYALENNTQGTIDTLYTFDGSDGYDPAYGVSLDSDGNIYGTTSYGGPGFVRGSDTGKGIVFELPAGSSTLSILDNFSPDASQLPSSGVLLDGNGNLFYTTQYGVDGTSTYGGSLFEYSTSHVRTLVKSFNGGADGLTSLGNLTLAADGTIYGTTQIGGVGGSNNPISVGTVYKVNSTGCHLVKDLRPSNGTYYPDGFGPEGGLLIDSAGTIYGTDLNDGEYGQGVLFKIDTSGNIHDIYTFGDPSEATNGYTSISGVQGVDLAMDADGNVFGTANTGAHEEETDFGLVYEISSVATAYHLAFTTQPSSTPQTETMAAVQVTVENASGSPVTGLTDNIHLTLTSNTTGAVLSGTVTEAAGSGTGVATFSDLAIDKRGTYTLTATDSTNSAVFGAISGTFTIGLPVWLNQSSIASWNFATKTLTVTGATTIIADPSTDEPNIIANGAPAQVAVQLPTGTFSNVHVGGISLTDGAGMDVKQIDTPTAGDLSNGEFVASDHATRHLVLVVGQNGGATPTFDVSSGKLDLEDNDMLIHSGNFSRVQGFAATGRDGGDWAGNGLTSTVAKNQDNSDGSETVQLAVVLNSDLSNPFSTWPVGNEPVSGNDVLVKYTYTGDFDLNGKVDVNDSFILNGFYDNGASTGNEWAFGDTNGDGKIDVNDSFLFNGLYGNGSNSSPFGAADSYQL